MISAELTIFRRILLISKDIWWKCLYKLDKFINMTLSKKDIIGYIIFKQN